MKKICLIILLVIPLVSFSQKQEMATWIWFPGDFEVWLHKEVSLRRQERGSIMPTFYRLDDHFGNVRFFKKFNLPEAEKVDLFVDGEYIVNLDGKYLYETKNEISLPKGQHTLFIQVVNYERVPSIFVKGNNLNSDASWEVTNLGALTEKVGYGDFYDPKLPPSTFKLETTEIPAVKVEKKGNSVMVDFGKETIGFIKLKGLSGKGKISFYYGESLEEASSKDSCETLDRIDVNQNTPGDFLFSKSRALRFLNIEFDESLKFGEISLLHEYLPLKYRASFRSSDEKLNKIWEVGAYTLHLNTREFFLDGIKRDRWIWSGDAYQSFLMNYYLFFDQPVNRRTLFALRQKDPVEKHINTILDYSFYWFVGIYDHFLYTGDTAFIKQIYPKMVGLMDFCLNRRNSNGMVEGLPGDWVFIDWADMDKEGEVSFEQVLFARSLEAMALCSEIANDKSRSGKYKMLAEELKKKTLDTFWDEKQKALVHNRKNGKLDLKVTKYANMFAMMFGYLDVEKLEDVKTNVLLNDKIQSITTPYMRFYELAALCEIGEQDYVMKEMLSYWGGMLDLGATSFWEVYNPEEKGRQHLAMYGRNYGRSLCHAWGASPVYLLGKYYLGVKPTSAGYQTFEVEPSLGGLKWIEGTVPTPNGEVKVFMDSKTIKVKSTEGTGILKIHSATKPAASAGTVNAVGKNIYQINISKNQEIVVKYKPLSKKG